MNMNVGLVVLCLQLLVIKINSSVVKNGLPEGYRKYRDLGFYKIHTTSVNWNVARQTCENENAYLVVINSQEELELIGYMMQSQNIEEVHAGFNDLVTEGEFYTTYGQPLSSTYIQWNDGEPNNLNGDENCGNVKLRDNKPGLNDLACGQTRSFVCELK
ncbi:hemolymph lipopolysaccharide-binding protein [Anabrus simplex]|uniref:hemolymph lipopolysaccharide-binding protein n=1 Tax=Anabrus simplex TaxID=316456 RepID=UPI0035A361C8